ncbi:Predicted acylesterase/phospholipase RssA, contains patatin domain [Neorhodopirellula lusitana]|uniref:Predicted acylesterase/phospholipase RssA, contains patatin domain n=1 Tax=Neorhodopirellula lusitana TaxID=445327 RepID=A0ABY1PRQ9_9BACT|nr:cyclic nucleotide-binding and patatin-like phospholipase domain-containing protein [Neorhodopirellula lusitana]SMP43348.1 Predicted acylesterase/phospholipase RssA, contains patatin domain [Neorhodopirellula lusitana]
MQNDSEGAFDERIIVELKRLPWCQRLSDSAIADIAAVGEYVHLKEGAIVHLADQTLTSVFFVVDGRLLASVMDRFGNCVLERELTRGTAFGLLSIAQPDQASSNVVATEPTTGIRLGIAALAKLASTHTDLQMNLYRLAGNIARQIVMVDRTKRQPKRVSIVHQSPACRQLTPALLKRLKQLDETLCVLRDDPEWHPVEDVPFRLLFVDGKLIGEHERQTQLDEWSDIGRIFIDLDAQHEQLQLVHLMSVADRVLWCVQPSDAHAALNIIKSLQSLVAGWREKICLVWLLDDETTIPPYFPEVADLVERDFKISFAKAASNQGGLLPSGVERIVHHLRGIQIGIALGGGAARGMAHLGVLKVLEDNGIYVDMMAGTSAGAMTGVLYSSGMSVDYTIESFKKDLRLPWYFRCLPGGSYWYLLVKYRRGGFAPMLRKYLGNARLEQLPLPMCTVTVDLVRGRPVVREVGDAVRCILESINIPGFSVPIVGDGEALIDGGIVNNIPADVLVDKGCNFVIVSSVTAKLEAEFAGICADQPGKTRTSLSVLNVLMRASMVQNFNMNSVGVQPADFIIEPDVTAFDLSEFERTDELAAVGESSTSEVLEMLKQQLSKLDSKLFPWDS